MASGIYKIENTVSGQCYIGSAVHLVNRWAAHRRGLNKGEHRNRYLQRAWVKYGPQAFRFVVLEEVSDPAQLVAREQVHIDGWAKQGKLYNLAPRAGSNLGTMRTAASKAKARASNLGQARSDEARAAMSEAQKRSMALNPEFKAARAQRLIDGRKNIDREKHRVAVSKASRERVWSEESRAKLSASRMGIRLSDEATARMAATKCKPVMCMTTGVEYASVIEAGAELGIHYSTISKACLGKLKTAHKMTFRFL